jgi:murein L,D-transpeptidase YafK
MVIFAKIRILTNEIIPLLFMIPYPEFDLASYKFLIIAFKQERLLTVYTCLNNKFKEVYRFSFTAFSGTLGPKLREGDGQIPEGIYTIDYLNPNSKFCKSFKLNYPNSFDLEYTTKEGIQQPGSDIFIHGGASSKGCIAIGDEAAIQLFHFVEKEGKDNFLILIFPKRPNPDLSDVPVQTARTTEIYKTLEKVWNSIYFLIPQL